MDLFVPLLGVASLIKYFFLLSIINLAVLIDL